MNTQKGNTTLWTIIILLVVAGLIWFLASRPGEEGNNNNNADTEATVQIYFGNTESDPEALACDTAYPVARMVDDTTGAAQAALAALLAGPTVAERAEGYVTSIRSGATLESFAVENGVALVNFTLPANTSFNDPQMGACGAQQVVVQVERTLMQFPDVTSVEATVNGVALEDTINP